MRTFPGWRAAGRAMAWVRRQDGIEVTLIRHGVVVLHQWSSLFGKAGVDHSTGSESAGFALESDAGDFNQLFANPATILRVLAALELIPAELADVRNERYGRCEQCGRLIRLNPERLDGFPVWWHHIDQDAWLAWGPHRAEVAE